MKYLCEIICICICIVYVIHVAKLDFDREPLMSIPDRQRFSSATPNPTVCSGTHWLSK